MMSKILSKGATVAVKGSLQYRTYEDKSGKEQRIAEVLVNEFLMMDKTKDSKEVTDKKVKKQHHFKPFSSYLKVHKQIEGATLSQICNIN
ncbi:MAG: single-stranded DNA-binding protein [Saprospiraceae bacterium]|nr:single-stranded DNA-binding protein [Saprospiraceae bacterium]